MEHFRFIFSKSKLKICKLKRYSNYHGYSVNNNHLYLPHHIIFSEAVSDHMKEKQLRKCFSLLRRSCSLCSCILMGIAARIGMVAKHLHHLRANAWPGLPRPIRMGDKQAFKFVLEQKKKIEKGTTNKNTTLSRWNNQEAIKDGAVERVTTWVQKLSVLVCAFSPSAQLQLWWAAVPVCVPSMHQYRMFLAFNWLNFTFHSSSSVTSTL